MSPLPMYHPNGIVRIRARDHVNSLRTTLNYVATTALEVNE